MFLTPREVDQVLREVRGSYLKLRNDSNPHNRKVGLYGLLAVNKVQEGFVEKLKEKGGESPPQFF